MNLIKDTWVSEDYDIFINYLMSLKDENYQLFHSRLLKNDNIEVIGIRTPILKEIAREISKGNYETFISQIKHLYYEEDVIYGLMIGYLKIPFTDILNFLDNFIPFVNNWSTNDLVCANMKIFKKNLDDGFKYILKLLDSKKPWKIRFGLVLLLDFYINDDYIDKVITICNSIKSNEYYVIMANAWVISICYIKYKNKTMILLKENNLDDFTFNKAIQKIIESNRISKAEKEEIRKLKRKK